MMHAIWILALSLALVGCSEGTSGTPADEVPAPVPVPAARAEPDGIPLGQLSDLADPVHYRVHLTIDPQAARFSGRTEIDVDLNRAADGLWLHGKDLSVSDATVRAADGSEHEASYEQRADIGVARVEFGTTLPAGRVTLGFEYSAPFDESLEGLYRISAGGTHYASTQFEATSARLTLPSFDEPRFKVPFDISLTVPEGDKAVTNTPVVAESAGPEGFTRLTFATTRPLPTYLLAFIVGPWDEQSAPAIPPTALRDTPVPLRGFAGAGKGGQLAYALAHTSDIVNALEAYFGTAYPYRKLDIIAVPDFAAGAMENAGAITYREQLLLFGPDATLARKQAYASVHAHELAHQWFGNLVTPLWWNDIWLNEAFATWMAAKVMDGLEPQEGYAMRQLRDGLAVMNEDAKISARQIRQAIAEHSDIGSAFDGITYEKGGAVLTMLERFVGAENFRDGIRHYMAAHRFGNADARDFVQAIAATRPDLPEGQVEAAFFSFLEQPGLALVEVDWRCETDDPPEVSVTQSRYLPTGSLGDSDQQWLLPMCVAYGSGDARSEHCELIDGAEATFALPTKACPDYLMPNAGAAGYYRFTLSDAHWQALLTAGTLTDPERLAVGASLSGAFRAGRMSVADYLTLARSLAMSDNVDVVTAPLGDLQWIHDYLLTPENQDRLETVLGDMYADAAARVPLELKPRDRAEEQLQSELAELYGLLIEAPAWRQPLGDWGKSYVDALAEGRAAPGDMPANLRRTALTVAVEGEGPVFAERLLGVLADSSDASLRQDILIALDRGGDAATLQQMRALMLTDAVRDNEIHFIIGTQLAEPDSRDEAWDWLLANFDAVVDRLPYWSRGSLVEYGASFCSTDRIEQIDERLADRVKALGGGPRSLATTVEGIALCEALARQQEDDANSEFSSLEGAVESGGR